MVAVDEFDELFGEEREEEEEERIEEDGNLLKKKSLITHLPSHLEKDLINSQISLLKCPSFFNENDFTLQEGENNHPRIIHWNDGSTSLFISVEKHFDISTQKLPTPFVLMSEDEKNSSLKSITTINTSMLIRRNISSDNSNIKDGLSRMKLATTNIDPEAEKQRIAKLDTERLREKRRKELKIQKERQMKSLRKSDSVKLSTAFLEEDEEDEEEDEDDQLSDGFINDESDEEIEDSGESNDDIE